MSLIGVILLIGIVKKNAIVMVDSLSTRRAKGCRRAMRSIAPA
jgi:multidrug efflux pump subunit AcrB